MILKVAHVGRPAHPPRQAFAPNELNVMRLPVAQAVKVNHVKTGYRPFSESKLIPEAIIWSS
jgi:hypothetical protein